VQDLSACEGGVGELGTIDSTGPVIDLDTDISRCGVPERRPLKYC